jgi:hypothetical protein
MRMVILTVFVTKHHVVGLFVNDETERENEAIAGMLQVLSLGVSEGAAEMYETS